MGFYCLVLFFVYIGWYLGFINNEYVVFILLGFFLYVLYLGIVFKGEVLNFICCIVYVVYLVVLLNDICFIFLSGI